MIDFLQRSDNGKASSRGSTKLYAPLTLLHTIQSFSKLFEKAEQSTRKVVEREFHLLINFRQICRLMFHNSLIAGIDKLFPLLSCIVQYEVFGNVSQKR